jgi:hypothetical protein
MTLHAVPKPERPETGTAAGLRYLALVRQLPCVCCGRYPSAAHHPIMGRFARRRSSDFDAIPLCYDHHQGNDGIHASPAKWRALWGADTDYCDPTRRAVEALKGRTI